MFQATKLKFTINIYMGVGVDPGFSERGSEPEVDLEGRY